MQSKNYRKSPDIGALFLDRRHAYMLDDEAPPLFACLSQLLHRRLPGAGRLGQRYREHQP
ncbi:hypothetical protein ACMX2M_07900 [Paenibacillus polymyxa]